MTRHKGGILRTNANWWQALIIGVVVCGLFLIAGFTSNNLVSIALVVLGVVLFVLGFGYFGRFQRFERLRRSRHR